MKNRVLTCALLLVTPGIALSDTEITHHVFGDGAIGGTAIGASATYSVVSTLGQAVIGTFISDDDLYRITAGFWAAEPIVVGVEDDEFDLPASFLLYKNAPNPFNPQTTISYDVPTGGGEVRLTIYNIDGTRVRTLVAATQVAGRNRVTWNGRDDHGRRKVLARCKPWRARAPG